MIDMFLFSGFYDEDIHFPKLSKTLTDKLVAKKRVNPHIQVIFITDEVNSTYQSYQLKELKKMRENGIEVIVANLDVYEIRIQYTLVFTVRFCNGLVSQGMVGFGTIRMGSIRLIMKNIRINFLCLSILPTVYRRFSNSQPTNFQFPLIRKFRF